MTPEMRRKKMASASALGDLRPMMKDISVRFIILGGRRDNWLKTTAQDGFPAELWIADETASATLLLVGASVPKDPTLFAPGDIFWLFVGETRTDGEGRLQLALGRAGCLERAGFLTMLFTREPDISQHPWARAEQEMARQSKNAVSSESHNSAPSAPMARQSKNAVSSESHNSAPSAPQKGRCFLCDSVGHPVYECPEISRGLSLTCASYDTIETVEKRRLAVESALAKVYLPRVEKLRWYQKAQSTGIFYARFQTESYASQVLNATAEFEINGCQIEASRITKPSSIRKKGICSNQSAQKGNQSICLLCGGADHDEAMCHFRKHVVVIDGAEESQFENLRNELAARGVSTQSLNMRDGRCFAQLTSGRQALKAVKLSRNHQLLLDNKKITARFFSDPPSVDCKNTIGETLQTGNAAAVQTNFSEKRSGSPCQPNSSKARKIVTPHAPGSANQLRKTCFLCGDSSHELPICPLRKRCALICRDWGSLRSDEPQTIPRELRDALLDLMQNDLGLKVVRTYWHSGVCYAQLGTELEAQNFVASLGPRGQLRVGDEVMRVREAKSTRKAATKSGGSALKPMIADHADEDLEDALQADSDECALCGNAGHGLARCEHLTRGLIIRGSGLSSAADFGEAEVLKAALSADVSAPQSIRWRSGALYLLMANARDAEELATVAVGEGLEVGGEPVSIEIAQKSEQKMVAHRQQGITESRGSKHGTKGKEGKGYSKGRFGKAGSATKGKGKNGFVKGLTKAGNDGDGVP